MRPRLRLVDAISSAFPPHIRIRGQEIPRQSIRILSATETAIAALISGTEVYNTEAILSHGHVHLRCTCPYFMDKGPCKHIWALALEIERKNLLSPPMQHALARRNWTFEDPGLTVVESEEPFELTTPLKPPPEWLARLSRLPQDVTPLLDSLPWPPNRTLYYSINRSPGSGWGHLVLKIWMRDGEEKPHPLRWPTDSLESVEPESDRELLVALQGYGRPTTDYGQLPVEYMLPQPAAARLIPRICATERCFLTADLDVDDLRPLEWKPDAWRLVVQVRQEGKDWVAEPLLEREGERRGLNSVYLLEAGLVLAGQEISPVVKDRESGWLPHLRQLGKLVFPEESRDEVILQLLARIPAQRVEIPEDARFQELTVPPRKFIQFRRQQDVYVAQVHFVYGEFVEPGSSRASKVIDRVRRVILHRDLRAESEANLELLRLGLEERAFGSNHRWVLPVPRLREAASSLIHSHWEVRVEDKPFRQADRWRTAITSGIDWFDVNAEVDFGDVSMRLPALLEALQSGSKVIDLPDGSFGIVPEDIEQQIRTLAGIGRMEDGQLRFHRAHTGLLDALLASAPEVRVDEPFARLREELHRFTGIEPAEQPEGFRGQLRDYQKAGLAWLHFLRRFGFGGCLADDMGVGKTPQVLALLETRRGNGPSLVVVPKSVVFNWQQEAARFTPNLRVLAHIGSERSVDIIRDYDLVITTYGTLRRDVPILREIEFDYIVLDEAQAVKNASSESAKAVRLLRAKHRLAMTGTPIENHLGELWSIFEFLNPGMLEAAQIFQGTKKNARAISPELRPFLAQALRPFLLRRTKQQVAQELPPKMEQTLVCELEAKQRELYDDLRDHYRQSLFGRIDRQGLSRSRMHVLEALLRLRQAACHPGLIDQELAGDPSAKLDLLIERLQELTEEGHKALVFSQFTSFLDLVQRRMRKAKITFEYLDGSTPGGERQKRVERFQTDSSVPVFLISLKAGGVGLNLTAADYVFLLDPWWNPAVEAQAIDRAHRIGQTQHVFAYRLIAQDTVEEKILELQNTKRDLAAAIISEDSSVFRSLTREDLEMLLS